MIKDVRDNAEIGYANTFTFLYFAFNISYDIFKLMLIYNLVIKASFDLWEIFVLSTI